MTKAIQDHTRGFFAKMKAARVPKPQFPSTKEEVDKAWKMVKTLDNPPKLTPDYDRQIEKAHNQREDPRLLRTSPPRLVAQLGPTCVVTMFASSFAKRPMRQGQNT